MKKFFLLSVCCFLSFIVHAQVVSLTLDEVVKLKKLIHSDIEVKSHWQGLLKTADEALEGSPNAADTILSEGILQGDPRKIKTWKSLEDMQKIYSLGLAYKVSGEEKYLEKVVEFLLAWSSQNKPQGNPINDTNLERVIFTYDLVKADLKPGVADAIKNWLTEVFQQEVKIFGQAAKNKGSAKGHNNWRSHHLKIITQIAVSLENKHLKNLAIMNFMDQISKNLRSDGSSFDFHERDALHYHVYDVDPLLVAATILTRDPDIKGNFYTYTSKEGNSLKKSVEWLVPYFKGEKIHAEFVNSKSAFDKRRAENDEKGYIAGTLFKPAEARTSIALASYFDSNMISIYQNEAKTNAKYPTWQFVLNEVKRPSDSAKQ